MSDRTNYNLDELAALGRRLFTMFKTALRNLRSGDLNKIGLVLGFVGSVLVTIFGLPAIGVFERR